MDFQDGRHGGHLGFMIEMVSAVLIYQSPLCFLSSFESIGLSVQKKQRKIDGGHLGFPIRTFFSLFLIYKSPQSFLLRFESIGLSVQEKRKIDFQDGCHAILDFR